MAFIPDDANRRKRRELTQKAAWVYEEHCAARRKASGLSLLSNRDLAEILGVCLKTVQNAMSELKRKGWLVVTGGGVWLSVGDFSPLYKEGQTAPPTFPKSGKIPQIGEDLPAEVPQIREDSPNWGIVIEGSFPKSGKEVPQIGEDLRQPPQTPHKDSFNLININPPSPPAAPAQAPAPAHAREAGEACGRSLAEIEFRDKWKYFPDESASEAIQTAMLDHCATLPDWKSVDLDAVKLQFARRSKAKDVNAFVGFLKTAFTNAQKVNNHSPPARQSPEDTRAEMEQILKNRGVI